MGEGEGAGEGRVWERGGWETRRCGRGGECGRGEGAGEVCASSRKEPMFVDFVPENINCISVLVASSLLFY